MKAKLVKEQIATAPAVKPAVKPAEPITRPGTRPGRPSPIRRDKPAVTPRPKATAEKVANKFIAMSKKNESLRDLLKKKYNK